MVQLNKTRSNRSLPKSYSLSRTAGSVQCQSKFLRPFLSERDARIGRIESPHLPSQACQVNSVSALAHSIVQGNSRPLPFHHLLEESIGRLVEICIAVEVEAIPVVGFQLVALFDDQPGPAAYFGFADSFAPELRRIPFHNLFIRQRQRRVFGA